MKMLLEVRRTLRKEDRKQKLISLALETVSAVRNVNGFQFFRALSQLPECAKSLLSQVGWTMRFWTLQLVVKAYGPGKYPLKDLRKVLGFEDIKATAEYLTNSNCVLVGEGNKRKMVCAKSKARLK